MVKVRNLDTALPIYVIRPNPYRRRCPRWQNTHLIIRKASENINIMHHQHQISISRTSFGCCCWRPRHSFRSVSNQWLSMCVALFALMHSISSFPSWIQTMTPSATANRDDADDGGLHHYSFGPWRKK